MFLQCGILRLIVDSVCVMNIQAKHDVRCFSFHKLVLSGHGSSTSRLVFLNMTFSSIASVKPES